MQVAGTRVTGFADLADRFAGGDAYPRLNVFVDLLQV
jgi:hypothetical protein